MRKLLLALTAAGAIGIAASATPAHAGPISGLTAPSVESNTVNARCHHHRWSSRWHCYRRHYHYAPLYYYQPYHFHHHRWRHHHRWHRHRHHRHW